jgi:hypothetical protein
MSKKMNLIFSELLTETKVACGFTAIDTNKVKLLQEILTRIEKGEIDHDQYQYHCETAHCIAGWVEVYALTKMGCSTDFDVNGQYGSDTGLSPVVELYTHDRGDPTWNFAAKYLGLSPNESILLFDSDATFAMQQEMVRLFSLGYRFYPCNQEKLCQYERLSNNDGSKVEIEFWKIDWDEDSEYGSELILPEDLVYYCVKIII